MSETFWIIVFDAACFALSAAIFWYDRHLAKRADERETRALLVAMAAIERMKRKSR